MLSNLACLSHPLHSTEANRYHFVVEMLVVVGAFCIEVSGRIQDIHEVAVKISFGFLLHLFVKPDQADSDFLGGSIFCEHLLMLGKPLDSCFGVKIDLSAHYLCFLITWYVYDPVHTNQIHFITTKHIMSI